MHGVVIWRLELNMANTIKRTEAELRRMEQIVSLCRELDVEMDGEHCTRTVAAILNGIRSALNELDDGE